MIDMHLHTKWSDGNLTVSELVKKISEKNITHAVLTDHDCVLGTESFKIECSKYGIKTISGVELEAYYDLETSSYLHILCYNFEDIKKLNNYLEKVRNDRIQAIVCAISKLKKQNILINFEDVEAMSCGRHLLINHLCILLEKTGIVKSKFDAYNAFLDRTSSLYINYPKITVEDTIKKIYEVGGIPILAHPKRINMTNTEKENYVAYLKKIGIKGIETYYSFDTLEETRYSEYLANKYNLLQTVGSDWHCEEEKIEFGNKHISTEKIKLLKKEFFDE